eukprot:CAMPEP_0202705670 /NCGR_PEP_ID=MMETSP1385-20130828/18188_1 /ASSEMBLY_ACC=CAM_ASM_000861 /TAXON_ID=933848 /ORGANISM="Elphidium margaritaceum" /LENGTH=254 /DNA_ID=CAMNT_0049363957 /DNA_START=41 /DNA_END=805 /DNA_ORIENTATION=-
MKVLIPIKRVIDYTVKIRVRPDKKGVDKKAVKMSMNPFCEIAVEEAIRMKEAKIASELVAVTIGPTKCNEQLRTAMAMGIDRAIHIKTADALETDIHLQPLAVSRILAQIVQKETPQLVLLGKQSIDDDSNQVAQMLAGRLRWPQATFASSITVADDKAEVLREVDGGAQRVSVSLPAVISTDLRLNEPRFATLQNIMKARKKPIEEIAVDELGINIEPTLEYLEIVDPPVRKGGVFVDSVQELFDKMKQHECL